MSKPIAKGVGGISFPPSAPLNKNTPKEPTTAVSWETMLYSSEALSFFRMRGME